MKNIEKHESFVRYTVSSDSRSASGTERLSKNFNNHHDALRFFYAELSRLQYDSPCIYSSRLELTCSTSSDEDFNRTVTVGLKRYYIEEVAQVL